jgi:hypothetical protein
LAFKAKGKPLGFSQDPHYVPEANEVMGRFLYDAILAHSPSAHVAH